MSHPLQTGPVEPGGTGGPGDWRTRGSEDQGTGELLDREAGGTAGGPGDDRETGGPEGQETPPYFFRFW